MAREINLPFEVALGKEKDFLRRESPYEEAMNRARKNIPGFDNRKARR
jgi:hypothetical protein